MCVYKKVATFEKRFSPQAIVAIINQMRLTLHSESTYRKKLDKQGYLIIKSVWLIRGQTI